MMAHLTLQAAAVLRAREHTIITGLPVGRTCCGGVSSWSDWNRLDVTRVAQVHGWSEALSAVVFGEVPLCERCAVAVLEPCHLAEWCES